MKLVQADLSTKPAKEMLPAMIRAWMALVEQQMKEDERLERSHRDVGWRISKYEGHDSDVGSFYS